MEYYTTTWNSLLELDATLTSATKAAPGNHTHTNYATTSHTHTGYAATSHTHQPTDIVGYDPDAPITYTSPPAPASGGTTSGLSASITGTSFATFTINSANIAASLASPDGGVYALVEWSCSGSISSGSSRVDVAPVFSSATTIAAAASSGTSTHQSNATDGTAYNIADYASTSATSSVSMQGSRYVKLNSGTTLVTLQAKVTGGTGTISNPVVRITPVRFV
jgi:hypothetical protein